MNKSRSPDSQRFANRVHSSQSVGHANRCDIPAFRMARRHHARHVLLPAAVHDPLHFARRTERGIRAPRRAARELDVRIGIRLVVVQQNKAVVVGVGQSRGNRAHAHVGAATVAAESDDVDGLLLHLALAHEGLQSGGRPERSRPAAAELGVHPRHYPRGAVVGGISYIHAPGAAQHDRSRPGSLSHHLHYQRRLAALAGAVAGGEVFLQRNLLHCLERL